MSKELAFTDDNDVVKYLDTTTAFNLALTADGVAFDLTNAKSILVKIANDDGYIMQQTIDLTTVTSPLGGTLSFPINQNIMNTLVPDDYDIEVWVTMNDGTQAIFPSDGTLGFSIEENLMSDTGEVIPTISLNDFQQQFDDLSSQMANAVQNVKKGDQGNPGNGIKSANNQYQLSDSPVTVPTGGWSDTILATTDQLPHLWTKIIFTYDDGTTKETNFVSSRGDTGSQGPIGPEGPQGKQGNGLVVRGKADKEENLPTTGNNQGDGYLVGTNLYIWIDGSWQNMGSITPDLTDYVKVADMRKPANDVAGIEEVNAKQDKLTITPADDSKVAHLSGANNFDTVPTVNNNPLLLASSLPSDIARTGQVNTFNLTQTFSQGIKTLQTGSYDDANSLVNEGLYFNTNLSIKNGAGAITAGFIQVISGYWERVRQFMYSDVTNNLVYTRVSSDNGSTWSNWVQIITSDQIPTDLARTSQLANFTNGLQKSGVDVATTTDVSNAVNAITSNSINWTSLSVDSSQISDADYSSKQTNCSYRISHNTLYVTGQYVMLGNGTSSHNSMTLFKLPTNIVSQISFPITNKFTIGLLQAMAQQASMFGVNLTSDGKITCVTDPYDLNITNGASMAPGFINAAIPLN